MDMTNYLKISEFAKLSGISRKSLIHYDRCGILCPEAVDPENQYRYYSFRQIETAGVIVSLRETGMSLNDIKAYLSDRSAENLISILTEQSELLDRQMQRLRRIRGMIEARLEQTFQGLSTRAGEIITVERQAENIFLGEVIPADCLPSDGSGFLPAFFKACDAQGIPFGFPLGIMVKKEQLSSGHWNMPSCCYYRLPDGQYPHYATKPAGQYVIGTEYTDYGNTDNLYRKLFCYIEEHGFEIFGNSYEEFLLDEISEHDPDRYLLRIDIHIRKNIVNSPAG